MRNLPDFQVVKKAASFLFNKGIVCAFAFFFWHFTLGFIFPSVGDIVGVISAIAVLLLMLFFEGSGIPFENLEEDESRHLADEIIWSATFKSGKKLAKAYTTCNLKKAIDTEFIDPKTGDKYRLIFRRARNERMQASHLRRPLQATEEAKENIYVETDGDWQEPQTNKESSSEAPKRIEGVHEIAASLFGDT
jgi:hypothetical protein